MAHPNTVFAQMLQFILRHEFESLANQHYSGRRLRKMTRWTQFVAMATADHERHLPRAAGGLRLAHAAEGLSADDDGLRLVLELPPGGAI